MKTALSDSRADRHALDPNEDIARAHSEMGGLIARGQLRPLGRLSTDEAAITRGRSFAAKIVLGAAAVVIVYLSVRASPRVAEVSWMPSGLGRWADHYGIARNAVAFGGFGLVVGLICRGWRLRSVAMMDVVAFAAFGEVVQIWIPTRSSDLYDVGAAFVGVTVAAALIALGSFTLSSFEARRSKFG